jgi:hypothetical protein
VALAQHNFKQESSTNERVIQKIKDEILKELKEGGFLQQQIEVGIETYIKSRKIPRRRRMLRRNV